MLDEKKTDLLECLSGNWPAHMKFILSEGRIEDLDKHVLRGELSALENGKPVSLPFFMDKENEVRWFTAATNAEDLRTAIDKLRCWILPSLGWEESFNPVVPPGSASGQLGKLIVSIFPAGYFRWRSTIPGFREVATKLEAIRRLDDLKPTFVFDKIPSLFELRQQYRIALATGDRDTAMDAIQTIDHHQLDTALNTIFMRIRLWDQFRDYGEIANDRSIADLVYLRIPRNIRLSILRASHSVHVAKYEDMLDLEKATQAYLEYVYPVLVGTIRTLRPKDGLEARRCMGYLARLENDRELAQLALDGTEDPILASILDKIPGENKERAPYADIEVFYRAMEQGDWETLQITGTKLLKKNQANISPALQHVLPSILLKSLDFLPNQRLTKLLLAHYPNVIEKTTHVPQDWSELLESVSNRRWDSVRRFLNSEKRPLLTELSPADELLILDTLEELLTDPDLSSERDVSETANEMMGAFIEDFVRQETFPSDRHIEVYLRLLQIWSAYKSGSAWISDGQLLLTLADGVLSYRGDEKGEIAGAISLWWHARKVRALAPFLIEGLELLTNFTSDLSLCENLWIELADLVRLDPEGYSPGEKALLRLIGRRLNLDEETIGQFLKLESVVEREEEDILARTGFQKIAIVSLHEKTASIAAKMIEERTKTPVVLVTEKDAGSQTKNAKSADVILFVWSASKHSVYRAFDGLRDKIAYVQGVGASSILLSLERWVLKHDVLSHRNQGD